MLVNSTHVHWLRLQRANSKITSSCLCISMRHTWYFCHVLKWWAVFSSRSWVHSAYLVTCNAGRAVAVRLMLALVLPRFKLNIRKLCRENKLRTGRLLSIPQTTHIMSLFNSVDSRTCLLLSDCSPCAALEHVFASAGSLVCSSWLLFYRRPQMDSMPFPWLLCRCENFNDEPPIWWLLVTEKADYGA